jgi:hypothetical protein
MLGLAEQAYGQTDEACIAANEKAVSLGMAGKLLDELKELASCAAASCPDVVKVSCAQRLVELTAKIPSIVFDVRDASGNSLADVRLSIDGVAFGERLTGTAIPLDPGSHQFTFETAGQPAVTRTLILQEGERDRRESVTLGTPSPPVPAVAPGPSYSTASAPPEDRGHGRRVLGLIVGGVGLAGLGVGGIFGGLTFSSWGHANTECPSHSACSTQATNDRSSALTSGTISTVSVIAGGVLLAGGLALYFTAPSDHGPSIGVQLAPGALGVTGRFW